MELLPIYENHTHINDEGREALVVAYRQSPVRTDVWLVQHSSNVVLYDALPDTPTLPVLMSCVEHPCTIQATPSIKNTNHPFQSDSGCL